MNAFTALCGCVRGPYFATISMKDEGAGAYHFTTCGCRSHRKTCCKSSTPSGLKAMSAISSLRDLGEEPLDGIGGLAYIARAEEVGGVGHVVEVIEIPGHR